MLLSALKVKPPKEYLLVIMLRLDPSSVHCFIPLADAFSLHTSVCSVYS